MNKASSAYVAPSSAIILGAPGTGKSTLLGQIPGVYVLDCDENMAGPIEFLKAEGKFNDFYIDTPFRENGQEVPRDRRFQRAAQLLGEAAAATDVTTLAIDSLTTFVPIVLTEVLKQQGRRLGNFDFKTSNSKTYDEQMQIQDWGAFAGLMREFIFRLKSSGKRVVFTGHLKTKEDDVNKMLRQYINVPGQTADSIAGYFGEVWLLQNTMKMVNGKKTQHRTVVTFPNDPTMEKLGLKSSARIESGSELDVDQLIKALS